MPLLRSAPVCHNFEARRSMAKAGGHAAPHLFIRLLS